MIDINEHFDTYGMSDVAYHALKTFAENGLDISYLNEVNEELKKLKHWLLQLHYLYTKMSSENFFKLAQKLNYDAKALERSFHVICRR
ncbi:hypothetical protein RFI02_19890 [Acinetobacter sichuanensis]|uniref:hypothetical protein n=1 Tax=Acinetobacter sichuanensis TaxID=2136183 RepID=UPI00280FA509|nr:hypothetical protein [Acinetobacter sichuanensis]MDQ9023355.1 hypothetical protein [Acinetobacter sichuanensis]